MPGKGIVARSKIAEVVPQNAIPHTKRHADALMSRIMPYAIMHLCIIEKNVWVVVTSNRTVIEQWKVQCRMT